MDNIIPIKAAFDAYTNWDGLFIRGGHYSITDLLNPPKVVQLRKRHRDELPPAKVESFIKAFQGNAWHDAFERNLRRAANKPEWRNRFLIESKMWERVEGRKITGKLDCYDSFTHTLYDYKVTSTYKAMFGDYGDWEVQLNAYAWFLAMNNFPVKRIVIICIHPTWSKYEALGDRKYPKEPIHEVELTLWPFEQQEALIRERVRRLRDTEETTDEDLPECTDQDKWVRPVKYAIMEPGKKRATRVLDSPEAVDSYIGWRANNGKKPIEEGYTLEKRGGEPTRCLQFCDVNQFCTQYALYMMEKDDAA